MKSIGELGLKIRLATREYHRYTGVSAELEMRGAGCSRPELAWLSRSRQQHTEPAPQEPLKTPVPAAVQNEPPANSR